MRTSHDDSLYGMATVMYDKYMARQLYRLLFIARTLAPLGKLALTLTLTLTLPLTLTRLGVEQIAECTHTGWDSVRREDRQLSVNSR